MKASLSNLNLPLSCGNCLHPMPASFLVTSLTPQTFLPPLSAFPCPWQTFCYSYRPPVI